MQNEFFGHEHITVIEPQRGWRTLNLRELWAYRELLMVLAQRDHHDGGAAPLCRNITGLRASCRGPAPALGSRLCQRSGRLARLRLRTRAL